MPFCLDSLLDSTEEVESEPDESEGEREVTEEEEAVSAIQEEDFGVEYLLKPDEDHGGEGDNDSTPAPGPKKEITDIAAAAESLQPKGYTLATTQVGDKASPGARRLGESKAGKLYCPFFLCR